jgi:hypothetical protein
MGERPRLLNLFGYTGAGSVLAAKAGARVTHVDASRTTLAWVRDNLELSGLPADGIRIVLEDALRFVCREVRRGARYAGILIDPPSIENDLSRGGLFEAGHETQRGRLAATRGPEQREELPGTDLEVDALHGDDVVVVLLEFGDYDVPAT